MKFLQFFRQHIRFILISICSLTIVVSLALSGQRTDISSQPDFQKTSMKPSSTQTASDMTSNVSQSPVSSVTTKENLLNSSIKAKFGHFPYSEDDPDRLVNAGLFVRGTYERSELLDLEADQAFRQMLAAARVQGISLMIISGFRNIPDQSELFSKQIERRGSEEEAARASAPPGYSEHHTGYALDIADQQRPDTDLKLVFQETLVYRWLLENAPNYGFEQSFPLNNKQGINFEPWHWRYFGSPRAAQVFAAARQS